jgi:ketosteroid isomerase-like protein
MNHDVKQLDDQLNQMILTGQAMEGFETFYADDVVMQENLAPATAGKDANREREIAFFSSVEAFHGAELLATAVNGDVSFGEIHMDVTFRGGARVLMAQVYVRRWKDGRIVHERFYYSK